MSAHLVEAAETVTAVTVTVETVMVPASGETGSTASAESAVVAGEGKLTTRAYMCTTDSLSGSRGGRGGNTGASRGGKRGPANADDLDKELDGFMKPDAAGDVAMA